MNLSRFSSATHDTELEEVIAVIRAADPSGSRMAQTFRKTIDMLLDGQNTGRFRWEHLHKTEKTYAGTLIEINLQREFHFADGKKMDYRINDIEVDCKFSQDFGKWMIPPEAIGHICLLTWCDDMMGKWSAGLVRVTEDKLSQGRNRDQKANLSQAGRAQVRWIFQNADLPENTLLRLSNEDLQAIFSPVSGQRRVNELFRRALGQRISRSVIATVAQQDDYMKRVRYNGGARSALAPEGIVILGQYGTHVDVAARLELPAPRAGESLSIRLTKLLSTDRALPHVIIDGTAWRISQPGDPIVHAPLLPER